MAQVPDTRFKPFVEYDGPFLLWMGLLLFALRLGSRRQLGFELNTPEALRNLNRLSGCRQKTLAHPDTLDHYLGHVTPDDLHGVRRRMVRRLIRMKALDGGRLFGHFLVVLDGTGQLSFQERHCEHCLEQTVHGKTRYYHSVLEAKLVTPDGLAVSIGTEFIENADPRASKQDCELKAFARLADRLKKDFPQLRICLLLDALYANGTAMGVCEQKGWKYLITFKEGSMPALWQEYQTLLDLSPQNRQTHRKARDVQQTFRWVEGLQHRDDQGREHRPSAFQCREHDGDRKTLFAWLTNFPIDSQNVARWAIEAGVAGGRSRTKDSTSRRTAGSIWSMPTATKRRRTRTSISCCNWRICCCS